VTRHLRIHPLICESAMRCRFMTVRGVGSYAAYHFRDGRTYWRGSVAAWMVWHWPNRAIRRALWRRFEMAEKPCGGF